MKQTGQLVGNHHCNLHYLQTTSHEYIIFVYLNKYFNLIKSIYINLQFNVLLYHLIIVQIIIKLCIFIFFGNTKYIFSFFNISKLVSNQTTYVLLFTYMLCLCAVVLPPDLSEYTFLDRMADNAFTAHIQTQSDDRSMCIQQLLNFSYIN